MSQIQLVARGDIDASLTGNPSITFFTNFLLTTFFSVQDPTIIHFKHFELIDAFLMSTHETFTIENNKDKITENVTLLIKPGLIS